MARKEKAKAGAFHAGKALVRKATGWKMDLDRWHIRQGHRGGLVLPEPTTPITEMKVQKKVVLDSPDRSELLKPRSTKPPEAEGQHGGQAGVKKQLNFPKKRLLTTFTK